MIANQPVQRIARWRQGMLVYLTAELTLLAVALVELPDHVFNSGTHQYSSAWTILWLLMELFGLSAGLMIWFFPFWNQISIRRRVNIMFGYWGAAWVGCIALIFHNPMPVAVSLVVAGLGLIWLLAFSIVRRNGHAPEEMFP